MVEVPVGKSNSKITRKMKHPVTHGEIPSIATHPHLSVCHSFGQRRYVALSKNILPAGHSMSITSEKHGVIPTCRDLNICPNNGGYTRENRSLT